MDESPESLAARVLLLAPTSKDAAAGHAVLEREGVACLVCRNVDLLCDEAGRGAAALVLAEEAVLADRDGRLTALLADQPPWSDIPLVVLTTASPASPRAMAAIRAVGHATFVKRPLQRSTFVSVIASALRDRRRQYRMRDLLRERELQAERLEEADRRKDEFLAMLAHELRNPLAAVVGAVGVAMMPGAAKYIPESLEIIRRQSKSLSRLVSDLLDVARISRGKVELRREVVDLAAIAAQCAETARPRLELKRQTLSVEVPTGPLFIDADPTRIEQVVGNLLDNASKYTDPGGRVTLAVAREGGWAVVRVEDDGVGIPPEMLPRVFDLFAQVDQSLARTEGGLGIGLTLVKRLVDLHEGSVAAASEVGRGSAFTVRLPVVEVQAAPTPEAVAPTRAAGSLRILIVDDNIDSARSLGICLEAFGHDVHLRYDGEAAIAAALDLEPDIILLDVGLPGLDGYEVARRLKRKPADVRALIIAVTGYADATSLARGREVGFDHYFAKPVDLDALASLIAQRVERGGPDPTISTVRPARADS